MGLRHGVVFLLEVITIRQYMNNGNTRLKLLIEDGRNRGEMGGKTWDDLRRARLFAGVSLRRYRLSRLP